MKEKIYNIINQICCEGISNGQWITADVYKSTTKDYFGTEEEINIDGYILAVYQEPDDDFCFIKTDTADLELHINNEGELFPTMVYIWFL